MQVGDIVKILKRYPQDYDVRIFYNLSLDELDSMTVEDIGMTNFWVDSIEIHELGSSGYEQNGEVIIVGSE